MSLSKLTAITSVQSTLCRNPTSTTTLSCSDLGSFFFRCKNPSLFNQILSQAVSTGLLNDTYAASRILKFAADSTFVHVDCSRRIFASIGSKNGFIWNTMFRALLQRERAQEVIPLYKSMLRYDFLCIDRYTYPVLIHGCSMGLLSEFHGRQVQDHALKLGFGSDVYVVNNLINMYSVCGNMVDARKVFDESPEPDMVSWNSLLSGYVFAQMADEAKSVYLQMPQKTVIASNSMIALFCRIGQVNEANRLFNNLLHKDLVSWTSLISGYEQNGMYEEALGLFSTMWQHAICIDEVIIVSILSACSHLPSFRTGESVHSVVVKTGFELYVNPHNALIYMYSASGNVFAAQKLFDTGHFFLDLISWNSMVSGYVKCGLVERARELFDIMPKRDVVSWSSMITGYAQNEKFSETIQLFHEMQCEGVKPDEITLVGVISACAHLSALEQGKQLDDYIQKNGLKVDAILGTALIDMYMKCGSVESALEVFYQMAEEERGVSSWNSIILGLAMNGRIKASIRMFEEMKTIGIVPNEITFVAVLGACRHDGRVEEGRRYFMSMVNEYGIEPNSKHYGCLVDLLGRAGMLKEAEEVINGMPPAAVPNAPAWGALLGACEKHGDKEIGERIGRKAMELQPEHDGFHVVLSNIHASKGEWDDALEIRGIMARRGVAKTPGCSAIDRNALET